MDKRELRDRLRTVQGHMAAVVEMMERDAPCSEIVRQLHAVRGAVRAINRELCRAYWLDPDRGLRARDERERVRAWRTVRAFFRRKRARSILHHTRTASS